MSSTKQKWYKRLAVVMLALFATVWLGSPFAVYADNDATPTDATETIPKDLFILNEKTNDLYYSSKNKDSIMIYHCSDSDMYATYVYPDIPTEEDTATLTDYAKQGDSIDSLLDSYISSVNKDDRVAGIYFSLNTRENPDVDTIYIYEVATKKLLYTMTLDESKKYTTNNEDFYPYSWKENIHWTDEEIEDSYTLHIKNYSTSYVYQDNDSSKLITGVAVNITTDEPCTFVEADKLFDVNYVSDTNVIVTITTSHDTDVIISLTGDFRSNTLNLNLTGIDAHNDALIDDTLPEIDYTDLDVVFEGVPAKGTYNEGQDVTLTMKATTPSELFFDGDEVVAPFGKESTITVSKNGSYLYSAKAENGQLKSGVLEVTWFNYVDDDGNPIPDEDSPNSDKHETWSWEDRQNPWTHYTDAADNYLVQTGIYEKGNSVPTLAIIWVSIISAIVVGGFIYYKKGVKRNEEK